MPPSQRLLSTDKITRKKDKPQFTVMGVVPEKQMFPREMLSSFNAHFLGQYVETAQSLDGLAVTTPGCPPPSPLSAPSGLSRIQFMAASQAIGLPFVPSYCHEQGGVVLDRVVLKAGGEDWWTSVAGRVRLQNLLNSYQDNQLAAGVTNPSNYSIGSFSKILLGRKTTIRFKTELDGLSCADKAGPVSALANVRRKIFNGAADIKTEVGFNTRVYSPMAEGLLPLHASAQFGTTPEIPSHFQYRVGVYHATAKSRSENRWRSITALQGGTAFQGERTVWRGKKRDFPDVSAKLSAVGSDQVAGPPKKGVVVNNNLAGVDLSHGRASPATGSVNVTGSVSVSSNTPSSASPAAPNGIKAIGPHNPLRQTLRKALGSLTHHGDSSMEALEDTRRRNKKITVFEPEKVQEVLLDSTQSINRLREDVQGITSWVSSGSLVQQLTGPAGSIANKELKSGSRAPALSKDNKVRSSGSTLDGKATSICRQASPGWSAVVSPPHFKIGGMAGLLARLPLLPLHDFKETTISHQSLPGSLAAPYYPPTPHGPLTSATSPLESNLLPRSASAVSQLLRRSLDWMSLQGGVKGAVTLQPVLSGGALLQLGSFQKKILDFTRIMIKADLGLACKGSGLGHGSEQSDGSNATAALATHTLHYQQKSHHPALVTLAGRSGVWHSLSLSVSQQLVGPVRLFADLRYALTSRTPPSAALDDVMLGSKSTSGAAASTMLHGDHSHFESSQLPHKMDLLPTSRRLSARAVRCMTSFRPSLLEASIGLDVSLPMTSGLARLALWYSTTKKEGLMELRLF
ncbi:hypothetical protein CEUSTIGMA_g619.t1 [Chlamydomonas eustigma]|uniref:Uncharacterized protein n=1 Tax=Chlamydomonas eustigma TaxID=1157962 RepID=A0A250WR43_9CHLO|nr:hypothetical protein CEUSTIGMA_g619.t1 [Chlamydomonas eustigma]|eukprot:GAX73166.1 hypothetical protein CEUSTIGMA_g619.t1 [Chlamydomonas eustigma]